MDGHQGPQGLNRIPPTGRLTVNQDFCRNSGRAGNDEVVRSTASTWHERMTQGQYASIHDLGGTTPRLAGSVSMSVARLPGVLTVPEAATQAAVSAGTLRKEIEKGNLRARRIGRCVRILDEDLAAWLRSDGLPMNSGEEAQIADPLQPLHWTPRSLAAFTDRRAQPLVIRTSRGLRAGY
jgi:excisionase family DNA binding protein